MQRTLAAIGLVWLICAAVVAWRDIDTRPVHAEDVVMAPMVLLLG